MESTMSSETNRRILVIDDNPAIHDDFKKILTRQEKASPLSEMASELFGAGAAAAPPDQKRRSYEIASAYQGEQGFALVRAGMRADQRFSLAFVDMRMPPGWDGVQTIEKLWSADPEIQIVICTAHSDYAWEDILAKFGESDRLLILKKPFDTVEVCQLACALTEKWRLAKQAHLKLFQLEGMVEEQTKQLVTTNRQLQQEIAERRRSEDAVKASESRYALAAAGANDGLWDWDLERNEVFYSARWKLMLGYEAHEITDSPEEWLGRTHLEDRPRLDVDLAAHFDGREAMFFGEYRMRGKDDRYRWMLCRGLAVRDGAGKALRIAGSQTDMTDRKLAEEQLRHDACHDALTGLANRVLLTDRIERCLLRTRRHPDYMFAVLFLDLDKFKVINDSLGHLVGDKLLMQIAARFSASLRVSDTVALGLNRSCLARVGGDEFVVLLDGLRNAADAIRVAERIQRALAKPFQIDGHEVFTQTSIGIAPSRPDYQSAEEILRDADTALYQAKAAARGGYTMFNEGMHAHAMTRWRIENELRRAIAGDELRLLYQPILDLDTGAILGCEALVRWHHPERGVISPADFIPVAEETGLIVPLGYWVLRTACTQLMEWQAQRQLSDSFCVSVNLSAKQLSLDAKVVEGLRGVIEETGTDPQRLRFEITESAMISGAAALALLTRIRALGVKFHLDDFGTGYSSLSYLHRMPIDALKIDQSFVRTMSTDATSRSIITAIVTLGHSLAMSIIAEGVETKEELEGLRAMKCDAAQGYYLHRPMDAAAAGALLDRESATRVAEGRLAG
jgi:diguanylate cyclase (GGDEF)-like protein/PAS domain S-box-containing protein